MSTGRWRGATEGRRFRASTSTARDEAFERQRNQQSLVVSSSCSSGSRWGIRSIDTSPVCSDVHRRDVVPYRRGLPSFATRAAATAGALGLKAGRSLSTAAARCNTPPPRTGFSSDGPSRSVHLSMTVPSDDICKSLETVAANAKLLFAGSQWIAGFRCSTGATIRAWPKSSRAALCRRAKGRRQNAHAFEMVSPQDAAAAAVAMVTHGHNFPRSRSGSFSAWRSMPGGPFIQLTTAPALAHETPSLAVPESVTGASRSRCRTYAAAPQKASEQRWDMPCARSRSRSRAADRSRSRSSGEDMHRDGSVSFEERTDQELAIVACADEVAQPRIVWPSRRARVAIEAVCAQTSREGICDHSGSVYSRSLLLSCWAKLAPETSRSSSSNDLAEVSAATPHVFPYMVDSQFALENAKNIFANVQNAVVRRRSASRKGLPLSSSSRDPTWQVPLMQSPTSAWATDDDVKGKDPKDLQPKFDDGFKAEAKLRAHIADLSNRSSSFIWGTDHGSQTSAIDLYHESWKGSSSISDLARSWRRTDACLAKPSRCEAVILTSSPSGEDPWHVSGDPWQAGVNMEHHSGRRRGRSCVARWSSAHVAEDDFMISHRAASSSSKLRSVSVCGSEIGSIPAKSRPMTLKREVRSLLNKVSPENETHIISQLIAIQIRSAEDLNVISTLIVDKALGDPFYSEVYVRCIHQLCEVHRSMPAGSGAGGVSEAGVDDSKTGDSSKAAFELEEPFRGCGAFKGMVLQCCSRVFQHFFDSVHTLDDDMQEADVDFDSNRAEVALKKRHRARACMRLVGHLFVSGILFESMLQTFLNRLLEAPEDSLWPPKAWIECACELVYTVGKELSRTPVGMALLKPTIRRLTYWKELREDVGEPRPYSEVAREGGSAASFVYPLRTQFMVQDTVEAHLKCWPSCTLSKGTPEAATCASRSLISKSVLRPQVRKRF